MNNSCLNQLIFVLMIWSANIWIIKAIEKQSKLFETNEMIDKNRLRNRQMEKLRHIKMTKTNRFEWRIEEEEEFKTTTSFSFFTSGKFSSTIWSRRSWSVFRTLARSRAIQSDRSRSVVKIIGISSLYTFCHLSFANETSKKNVSINRCYTF